LEAILPTKNPGNVESQEKLDFFCVWFNGWCVFVPVFPTFFCFIRKNRSRTPKPCPLVVEPDREDICAIVVEIKEP